MDPLCSQANGAKLPELLSFPRHRSVIIFLLACSVPICFLLLNMSNFSILLFLVLFGWANGVHRPTRTNPSRERWWFLVNLTGSVASMEDLKAKTVTPKERVAVVVSTPLAKGLITRKTQAPNKFEKKSLPPSARASEIRILCFVLISTLLIGPCIGDIARAKVMEPPYIPNACGLNNTLDFPGDNHFMAAGKFLFNGGSNCGTKFMLRCVSAASPGSCYGDQLIVVVVVDLAPGEGPFFFLSKSAYNKISANSSSINVEYRETT